jgi:flagellar biosynthesis anti-sigma factor FlgM
MKIDGNRPAHDAQATDGTRRSSKDTGVRQGDGVAPASGTGDRVELSGDAALRTAALKAANDSPAIRTELVDKMRQKLNAGQVGQDAGALADAILDDQLK